MTEDRLSSSKIPVETRHVTQGESSAANASPSVSIPREVAIGAEQSKIFGPSSLVTLFVPIIALIAALASGSFLFLNYVHVISGATWTGIDLFMGLVMSRVLRSLAPPARAQVIKKLVPIMLFLVPALSSVAITAGIYLATRLGYNFFSAPLIAAGIIVIILSIQGFGFLLPTEIRIYLELRKAAPDTGKVIKLGMRNVYFAGSQSVFQVALIFVMAILAVGIS